MNIFGYIKVEGGAVSTHRDSYLLANISVVSVRRPFLGGAVLLAGCFLGFSLAFVDLLHPTEIASIIGPSVLAVLISSQLGQLSLLSRDLRGSELSGAVWGHYSTLNQVRAEIVEKLDMSPNGDLS